jgi:hypothetical protein
MMNSTTHVRDEFVRAYLHEFSCACSQCILPRMHAKNSAVCVFLKFLLIFVQKYLFPLASLKSVFALRLFKIDRRILYP